MVEVEVVREVGFEEVLGFLCRGGAFDEVVKNEVVAFPLGDRDNSAFLEEVEN